MSQLKRMLSICSATVLLSAFLIGCDEETDIAYVSIQNDFDNPEMDFNPPWTICQSSFLDEDFGRVDIGETSEELEVTPGLDYVLMVAAWDDPDCNPENCLPIASRNEEEVVLGQTRIIAINLPNHQGPCPPEGIEPIPEDLYNRILELWPEYDFMPYDERTENPECLD